MGSYCLDIKRTMSSATEKVATAKAPKVAKAKKPAAKSSNPKTSVMVESAISSLKEKKGSSVIAIKKYIATNYKVDPVKHSHFIKKALASGVEKKSLIQVKGVGATGRFKLAKVETRQKKKPAPSKKAKTPSKKAKTPSKPKKKPSAKKATPKKKVEKSKSAKKSKPSAKKPVAKKAKPSAKKPAKKAAPKKK